MNALAKRVASDRAGLLEQLMAVVRPEFRVEVLVPAPEDPVLGVPDCAVPACDYPVSDHGLCNGHRLRWRAAAGRRKHSSWPIRDRRCGAGRGWAAAPSPTAATALPDKACAPSIVIDGNATDGLIPSHGRRPLHRSPILPSRPSVACAIATCGPSSALGCANHIRFGGATVLHGIWTSSPPIASVSARQSSTFAA